MATPIFPLPCCLRPAKSLTKREKYCLSFAELIELGFQKNASKTQKPNELGISRRSNRQVPFYIWLCSALNFRQRRNGIRLSKQKNSPRGTAR